MAVAGPGAVPPPPAPLAWALATLVVTPAIVAVCAERRAATTLSVVRRQAVEAVAQLRQAGDGLALTVEFDGDQTEDPRPWTLLFKSRHACAAWAAALQQQWKALFAVDLPLATAVA